MNNLPYYRRAGFALVEIMVTVAILAIGLLGLAGLQARAHTAEVESYSRAQALLLAGMMADRIAANRADADEVRTGVDSQYKTTTTFGAGNAGVSCTGLTGAPLIACSDLDEWDAALKGASVQSGGNNVGAVTGARGCISRQTTPFQQYVVTVAWAGRGSFGSVPTDRPCGSAAIPSGRRVVSTTVTIPDLGG
jgi:type IV pilus assembly protein PilV